MSYLYFPSCNFSRQWPETTKKIKAFMESRGVPVTGCCRPNHVKLDEDSALRPIIVCQTCRILLNEQHPDQPPISLYEYLDSLEDMVFPDYHGEAITLQDPWRSHTNAKEKAAVRSLMQKMNIQVVELPGTEEEIRFDGRFMFRPTNPDNLRRAPKAFTEISKEVKPMTDEEFKSYMTEYCKRFTTRRVASYSNTAVPGLNLGLPEGKTAVHIMQLIFPD